MRHIASLDDIPEHGMKFTYSEGPLEEEGILLKLPDGSVRAYRNQCRHLPMRLDERDPAEFFDTGKRTLMCCSHGASFRLEDGLCTAGPCRGSHLKTIPLTIIDRTVFVDEDSLGSFFDV